jgi:hypothetical protein
VRRELLINGENRKLSKSGKGNYWADESGSITPLISIYFVIVMTAIFIVADLSSTYIARRELINNVETALARASQELDELRYYYRLPTPNSLSTGENRRLPIDCGDAARTFNQEVQFINETRNEKSKSGDFLTIIGFVCDGNELRSRVSSAHALPFSLPIFSIKEFTNVVEVAVTVRYS